MIATITALAGGLLTRGVGLVKSNGTISLVVAGVVTTAVVAGVIWLGIEAHDNDLIAQTRKQAETEQRAREAEARVEILQASVQKGLQTRAERDTTIVNQRARIEELEAQQREARDASAKVHDPNDAMFRVDDPWWLRKGRADRAPGIAKPANR